MPFNFKKEYRDQYNAKTMPSVVEIPPANYITVRGKGDPNAAGGSYQQALSVLYTVAYTLKMSWKTDYRIEGFYPYVVPPLEGFWWQPGRDGIDYGAKAEFCWISAIRLPDFIQKADLAWDAEQAQRRKKLDCSKAEFLTVSEGLCVQMMHIGSYDDEPATLADMAAWLAEHGYREDFSAGRLHHEIYLSDPRKTAPEKWRTILRHPIAPLSSAGIQP